MSAASMTSLPELRAQLKSAFVGRDSEIDGLLTAVIARTHLLLLGPPGTAKSLLTNVFADALSGEYFELLFAKQTTPDEVFGGIDIQSLEEGKGVKRDTRGMMPEAHVAFLDEVFKANSAILNSLLGLLNERKWRNYGGAVQKCPLQICVGASNEYPADSSLEALYDRFQLRFWTEYVPTRSQRLKLLNCPDPASVVTAKLSMADIATLQVMCKTVEVPPSVQELLLDVQEVMAREHGIVVSDRRLRQSIRLIQATALLNGRNKAEARDLIVLADSLWHRHDQRPAVLGSVLTVAAPDLQKAMAHADAAHEAYSDVVWSDKSSMQKALGIIRTCKFEIDTLCDLTGLDPDISHQQSIVMKMMDEIGLAYQEINRRERQAQRRA